MPSQFAIPDVSLNYLRDSLTDPTIYVALSDGTATPGASDTTLQGEFARVLSSQVTKTTGTYTVEAYFPSALVGGRTVRKVALFKSSSGGLLIWQDLLDAPVSIPASSGAFVTITHTLSRG